MARPTKCCPTPAPATSSRAPTSRAPCSSIRTAGTASMNAATASTTISPPGYGGSWRRLSERWQLRRLDLVQPPDVDAQHAVRRRWIEQIGEARAPDHLLRLVRRPRVHRLRERLVDPRQQDQELHLAPGERLGCD